MSEENVAAPNCQCAWVHKIKGGEPLNVAVCSLCGGINWALLKEDFEKAAREYARTVMETHYGRHDYPDGSRTICAAGLYNIKQIYNLFAMDTGQNLAAPEGRTLYPDEQIVRDSEGGIRIVKRGYL